MVSSRATTTHVFLSLIYVFFTDQLWYETLQSLLEKIYDGHFRLIYATDSLRTVRLSLLVDDDEASVGNKLQQILISPYSFLNSVFTFSITLSVNMVFLVSQLCIFSAVVIHKVIFSFGIVVPVTHIASDLCTWRIVISCSPSVT